MLDEIRTSASEKQSGPQTSYAGILMAQIYVPFDHPKSLKIYGKSVVSLIPSSTFFFDPKHFKLLAQILTAFGMFRQF